MSFHSLVNSFFALLFLYALFMIISQNHNQIFAFALRSVKIIRQDFYYFFTPLIEISVSFSKEILSKKKTRNVLSSQAVTHQVLSALEDFTAVFGMGTGVALPPSSRDYFSFVLLKTNRSEGALAVRPAKLSIVCLKNNL